MTIDPDRIKKQLERIRLHVQKRKEAVQLPFRSKGNSVARSLKRARQRVLKNINFAVREMKKSEQVGGAVRGIFEHIPQQKIAYVEEAFPKTVSCWLEVAQRLINGDYGKVLQEEATSLTETLFNWNTCFSLLLIEVLSSKKKGVPEILNELKDTSDFVDLKESIPKLGSGAIEKLVLSEKIPVLLRATRERIDRVVGMLTVEKGHRLAMIQILRNYLSSLANPSHHAVDLLLDNKKGEDSIKTAFSLKNPNERSRAFGNIITNLADHNRMGRAFKVVKAIGAEKEKIALLTTLVDRLLSSKASDEDKVKNLEKVDEMIAIAEGTVDLVEKKRLLQHIISSLSKIDQVDKAMKLVKKLPDANAQNYALSVIVNVLVSKQKFKKAVGILFGITNVDYREDAIGYIVKSLLNNKNLDEAIRFVESLDGIEKIHAAKIIITGLMANHNQEKAEEIREKFVLA